MLTFLYMCKIREEKVRISALLYTARRGYYDDGVTDIN